MTIEAVIFDRDGVLLDFDLVAATAFFQQVLPFPMPELLCLWHDLGEKVGFPRNLAEERAFFRRFWDQICDDYRLPPAARQQLHRFEYTNLIRPYPDARPALLEARLHGLRVGVLSNFSLASIEASLEVADLLDLVEVAQAAPVIGVAKPDPRAYLSITNALAVRPEACLLFDNKPVHVVAGRALGMNAYFVDRCRSEHDLPQGLVCDLTALSTILHSTI
jgi:putative hydrolase of the HAD superfamily